MPIFDEMDGDLIRLSHVWYLKLRIGLTIGSTFMLLATATHVFTSFYLAWEAL